MDQSLGKGIIEHFTPKLRRRVLVTGGGRGLGRAMVQAFLNYNATVFVLEKDEELLAALKQELPNVTGIQVDLEDWSRTQQVVKPLLPIHHLVNNAAISHVAPLLELQKEILQKVLNVNLMAPLNLTQIVGRGMIDNQVENGTIVNISSMIDSKIVEGYSAYHAAKAALAIISKASAFELGKHGIRVNYVRPGICGSAMTHDVAQTGRQNLLDDAFARLSIKRMIEPFEVANTVIYLSSPLSAMVTGTSITIDGGHGVS